MNYEQKYKEALDLARSYYSDDTNAYLIDLFPELAESEDERIRKDIIAYLRFECKSTEIEINERFIPYLEKQKEQKEIPLMNGDADLYFDNWIQHNDTTKRGYFEEGMRYAQRLQKEQKPVDNVSKEEYVKRFKALCDAYEIKLPNREYDIYHLCDDLSKFSIDSSEQKPAEWSEEDEKMLSNLITHIKVAYGPCDWLTETIAWLKSLCPQPH